MKKINVVLIIFLCVFISCTNENKQTVVTEVKQLISPAKDSCAEPYLFTDKSGKVYLSWIEKRGKESHLKFSALENEQWSEPVNMATGSNWFVNWADYPVIASDGNKNLLAHFLEKSDTGKFTYDVKLISSQDNGASWSNSKVLHDDGIMAEHGFVSIIPYENGFFISWLDGRNAAPMTGPGHEGHHGEMTVRGAIVSIDGVKEKDWELDSRVCDCCQTAVAITSNGPVVIYRDRSDDEVRDMSIVRYVKGEWTAPKTIFPDNWKIKACPVNGPRADAINNNLAIAWFSIPDKKAQVNIVFSNNGGESFNKPIQIDEGKPIGRVDVVMLDSLTAMVSWMEGSAIKAVKVYADGKKESSILIASSSESRSSGFPQMTRSGNKLFFAWRDDKEKSIRLATVKF